MTLQISRPLVLSVQHDRPSLIRDAPLVFNLACQVMRIFEYEAVNMSVRTYYRKDEGDCWPSDCLRLAPETDTFYCQSQIQNILKAKRPVRNSAL